MNRIDRLTAILVHLQSKSRVPLEEMEERFEVSRRTIFRDVKSLMEAGVPIGGDAGEGYFIVEGYHLPPVVFNKEEAAAILVGAKFIQKNGGEKISKNFEEAMYKIKAVLKYRDREFLENLEESISVIGPPTATKMTNIDPHIEELQIAIASQKKIKITYYSNYTEQTNQREVEPLGLVHYSGRWHLIAYCLLREDFRDFRTDRIQQLHITSESFDRSKHPNFMEFVHGMVGGTDAKEAEIRFSKKAARFTQDQRYYYGFLEETKHEDFIDMKFITPHYPYLAKWLLMYGSEVSVLSPPQLQGLVATYSKELFEHHQKYFTAELRK
ncbi:helix-turn-helix transcriptional regulator [Marinoscillum pacificum]|uniref:helix-turn-helix transcriptional regulator n=1 Tax=Marinoscillum pacificum TaxID=392723 RepID=UPI0021570E62|nr:YafY family protein [Marinoscillum pacificum]